MDFAPMPIDAKVTVKVFTKALRIQSGLERKRKEGNCL